MCTCSSASPSWRGAKDADRDGQAGGGHRVLICLNVGAAVDTTLFHATNLREPLAAGGGVAGIFPPAHGGTHDHTCRRQEWAAIEAFVGGHCRARRGLARHRGAEPGGERQCRMAGRRRGVRLPRRLPLLRGVHRQQGAGHRSDAGDAGLPPQRRPRLRADQPLRAVRPSFRGHRRRRPAGRSRAGGADGLPARHAVDPRRRGVRRRRAGHGRAVPVDPARRTFPGRHGAFRDGAGRRRHRRHRRAAHLHHHPGGARPGSGAGAGRQPMGRLHGVLHGTDRLHHGHLWPLHPPRPVLEMSLIGFVLLMAALVYGRTVSETPELAKYFHLSGPTLALMIIGYGFVASVLPVWLLLAPRDYLSTFMKVGVVTLLAIGIVIVRPDMQMPAVTRFIDGSGPVWAGSLFPFLLITIACGAVSGWHSLIPSRTTPNMIENERQIPFIGYGGMLTESFVAIMALIAASVLQPGV